MAAARRKYPENIPMRRTSIYRNGCCTIHTLNLTLDTIVGVKQLCTVSWHTQQSCSIDNIITTPCTINSDPVTYAAFTARSVIYNFSDLLVHLSRKYSDPVTLHAALSLHCQMKGVLAPARETHPAAC